MSDKMPLDESGGDEQCVNDGIFRWVSKRARELSERFSALVVKHGDRPLTESERNIWESGFALGWRDRHVNGDMIDIQAKQITDNLIDDALGRQRRLH